MRGHSWRGVLFYYHKETVMKKRMLALLLVITMVFAMMTACGKKKNDKKEPAQTSPVTEDQGTPDPTPAPETQPEPTAPDTENFIKLALHVLYNDGDSNYYGTEIGDPIYVTEAGQYTLTFDLDKDLSDEAKSAGIRAIEKLTAIYIYDLGASEKAQSPLKAANIKYDSVKVNDQELTITKGDVKSAFKGNGLFDTNDPVNSWEGSAVAEVQEIDTHVVSFTVDKVKTVSVTFTLSDLDWGGEAEDTTGAGDVVSAGTNNAKFSDLDLTDMNSVELTKLLGNGINLGNTFEATAGSKNLGVASYERGWGQPTTTREMIQGMKDCGFDTIRIPVAWTSTMDYLNGDYEINEDFMDRIKEVVSWAIESEMFVILNDHWDYGWWAMFGSSEQADVDMAWKVYEEMWTQIATAFADYSDMLIFESANEELGNNLNDNSRWAKSGHCADVYAMSNAINQKFVDIVRSTGGNNDDRFLLIAGINTNIANTLDKRFVMPTDTATGKLFTSVHYYDPWGFCGDNNTGIYSKWGVKKDFDYMEETLGSLKAFTDKGYGVIIGEWGALPCYVDGKDVVKENTEIYSRYMLDVCEKNNLCPVLWSTNNSYNKSTLTMINAEMAEIFSSHRAEAAMTEAQIDAEMAAIYDAAPEAFETVGDVFTSDEIVAYIMWNGGAGNYNVGDTYTPSDCPASIIPHDVVVDGAGEYTVSLDFPQGNTGLTFAALAINAGEDNYPGCIIDIKSITYDGEEVSLIARAYTSSDDRHCTRVNLINDWVSKRPDDARIKGGVLEGAAATILDKTAINDIHNITITFELIVK